MNPYLVATALALLTALLFVVLMPRRSKSKLAVKAAGAEDKVETATQPCPLCGSRLAKGERVHSVVYASSTPDKIMEISGCVHCKPPSELKRLCPVCKKELRAGDVVTARVFERKNETGPKRTHVHVLGCPRCRERG